MTARGDHLLFIQDADEAIGKLGHKVREAMELANKAAQAVADATGGYSCVMNDGREAFEMAAAFEPDLEEILSRTTLAKGSLMAYARRL